jgi:hypothetical protein
MIIRAIRRTFRHLANSRPPAKACIICSARSAYHPAGPLKRYTRNRINGHPVCHRHTAQGFTA